MKNLILMIVLLLSLLPNVLCADIRIMWDDEKKFQNVGVGTFIGDPLVEYVDIDAVAKQIFITPAYGKISSMFGWRKDPFNGSSRFHSGIDIANIKNSHVCASADGVVSFAGYGGACGVMVVIEHSQNIDTRYCHLGSVFKRVGESVGAGEHIGLMGRTGRSTGVHLHFEVRRDGVPVDPAQYIAHVR